MMDLGKHTGWEVGWGRKGAGETVEFSGYHQAG